MSEEFVTPDGLRAPREAVENVDRFVAALRELGSVRVLNRRQIEVRLREGSLVVHRLDIPAGWRVESVEANDDGTVVTFRKGRGVILKETLNISDERTR